MEWLRGYFLKDKVKDNEMKYVPLEKLPELIKDKTFVPEKPDYLTILCRSIETYEGFYPGSRSFRNNSPGNVRYSSVGYLPIYGMVLKDKDNFAIFQNYQTGWLYLKNLIIHKARLHPEWSLVSLMKEYAPESDGNSPQNYATYLGKRLGVNPYTWTLNNLL